jgi:hypothetical protein
MSVTLEHEAQQESEAVAFFISKSAPHCTSSERAAEAKS